VTGQDLRDLEAFARTVREHVIRMAGGGGCFLGASLSCADLIVYLYRRFLAVGPSRLADPDRDYLLLSKGHDVPALYATLAELGFFPVARLANHLSTGDHLYWHPNRAIPGVEFHSGSLGHLLSVGAGIAYDIRLRGGSNRVVVILGDGELNEGSVWEAVLVASAQRLGNLLMVVDRNQFQANVATESLVPLEPLAGKFEAFGCSVVEADGHDFGALDAAFVDPGRSGQRGARGAPRVVIAHTVRGRGLPSIEARADRWFCRLPPPEVDALIAELHQRSAAALTSEPLMVR
jgi:transketolase